MITEEKVLYEHILRSNNIKLQNPSIKSPDYGTQDIIIRNILAKFCRHIMRLHHTRQLSKHAIKN